MVRDLLYRVLWALAWVFDRALRAMPSPTSSTVGPPRCLACRRPVSSSRLPEVGELAVDGTCSETCAIAVVDGAVRRRAGRCNRSTIMTLTATRLRPVPSSERVCPGPDCSLCNGEACTRCLPIPGSPPCDRDVVERYQGVTVHGELREFDERRRPRN